MDIIKTVINKIPIVVLNSNNLLGFNIYVSRSLYIVNTLRQLIHNCRLFSINYAGKGMCKLCTCTRRPHCITGKCNTLALFAFGLCKLIETNNNVSITYWGKNIILLKIYKYRLIVPTIINTESLYGTFGLNIYSKFAKNINNSIFIDVGAYIGDTVLYAHMHKASKIIAIEPSKLYTLILKYNIKINKILNTEIISSYASRKLIESIANKYINSTKILKINCSGCEAQLLQEGILDVLDIGDIAIIVVYTYKYDTDTLQKLNKILTRKCDIFSLNTYISSSININRISYQVIGCRIKR